MDGWIVGSFSNERLFSTIRSYNFLYKQIYFIYCSIEEERCGGLVGALTERERGIWWGAHAMGNYC